MKIGGEKTMNNVSFVIELADDELLYSYLLRTARLNGFKDVRRFVKYYIWHNYRVYRNDCYKIPYDKIPYDLKDDLSFFFMLLVLMICIRLSNFIWKY
jgi:hypothetical protein